MSLITNSTNTFFKQLKRSLMKKFLLIFTVICAGAVSLQAQTSTATDPNNKFVSAMEKNIQILDTASSPDTYISLANTFERIGNAESNQWQPFYYSAYSYTMLAYMIPDKTKVDGIADRAESFLQKATAISINNSEISTLSAMITYCRLQVDPINRFGTLGVTGGEFLAKAKAQDPSNPRPYMIEARVKLNMPESMGGGVKGATPAINTAVEKFNAFVPANSIAPHWGKSSAERMAARMKGQQ